MREGGKEGGREWKKGEEVEEGEEREEIEEGEECGKVRKRDRECKGGGGGIKRERGNGERREKVFISFIPALMANITNDQQQKTSPLCIHVSFQHYYYHCTPTHNILGICISQRTLSQYIIFSTAQVANLSHSSGERPYMEILSSAI